MTHWAKWLMPASAVAGTLSTLLLFWYAGFYFGFSLAVLLVPGLVAFACMFGLRFPAVRMIGWYACVACLAVLVLACTELVRYGLPRFGG